ncbi:hypothetical protein M0805_002703 [Coniferiporia weirii]|nr:hypothetical protein M0805_002703 [Coniferiporia weirii]
MTLSGRTRREKSYYFCLIVFKAEDTLFRVPRERFEEHSDVFHGMFTLPACGDAAVQEGYSDEHPLVLEGVKAKDFLAFLKLLYPQPSRHDNVITESELLSALALARMWCFDAIQDAVLERLDALVLSPARRLELARIHDIRAWRRPALRSLALRRDPLSAEEAHQIGLELAVAIAALRDARYEALRVTPASPVSGSTGPARACLPGMEQTMEEVYRADIERSVDYKLRQYCRAQQWED